jgi:asparagine synthetase B (glutamine-hydrolysing)
MPIKSRMAALLATQVEPINYEPWLFWHKLFSESDVLRMTKFAPWRLGQEIMNLSKIPKNIGSTEMLIQRDREIWLPMESNRKLDRVSMYYSIEARSPFQDDEVVALGRELMSNSKYKRLEKVLLKETYPELESLGVRPDKAGFVSPVGHWLRGNQNLVSKSLNCLVENEILDKGEVDNWLGTPELGDFKLLKELWALTILGVWLSEIKDSLGAVLHE